MGYFYSWPLTKKLVWIHNLDFSHDPVTLPPTDRQTLGSAVKKLLVRLRDGAAALATKLAKPNKKHHQPDSLNQWRQTIADYNQCLASLARQLFANLFEGASFVRRVTVLEMLTHMERVIGFGGASRGSLIDIRSGVVSPGVALALYECLQDSYEENRMAALAILKGTSDSLLLLGFRSRSRGIWLEPEPLARLRPHLKYLFNNSRKLYGT